MRKKALLVGAVGPFSGPWVNLEEGEWAIAGPLPSGLLIEIDGVPNITMNTEKVVINGPSRVRALVDSCVKIPVFLQVCLIRRLEWVS